MAIRRSAHITAYQSSSLVASRNDGPPLLPYERQLITAIGISESEYRKRLRELYSIANRPAGYAHVPDVQSDPIITPLLVSLAVGAVLTGVSMLLAPKPPTPDEQRKITDKQLPNETGRQRFNQTKGFQGAPALATLGAPIAYIFGRLDSFPSIEDGEETAISGGIVAEPVLLWSRMEAERTFETFKLLMCIGLGQMDEEIDESNVMIAGQSIASYFESNVLLHHRTRGGRVKDVNRVYGNLKVAGGGPYTDMPYGCPDSESWYRPQPAFCQAYSSANTNSFGVYKAIRNGTRWSPNWEVISLPTAEISGKDDPNDVVKRQRRKIAGNLADTTDDGMKGPGRWYNPIHGVIKFEGKDGETEDNDFKSETAKIGDKLVYEIGEYQYEERSDLDLNAESGEETTSIGDIKNAIDTLRQEADNLLQEGEILLMNDVLLKVTSRPNEIWTSGKAFKYTLEVIGFTGNDKKVGIAGEDQIDIPRNSSRDERYDRLIMFDGGTGEIGDAKGTRWYSLMKAEFALSNNTRACDVTEMGIVSRVYNQANGLCNFPAVPTPSSLEQLDEDGVRMNTPIQNKYMYRTSFFHIFVQELRGSEGSDDIKGYERLSPVFAVSGNEPVDIRNVIRIIHPKTESYSFKFVPITSHAITEISETIYSLDTRGESTSVQTETKLGTFHLIFNAFIQSLDELSNLPEMRQGESSYDKVEVEYSGVTYLGPDTSTDDGQKVWAYNQGFFEAMLGQLKSSEYQTVNAIGAGIQRSETFAATTKDGRRARIKVTSEVLKNQWWTVNMGINRKWAVGGASFKLESYNADDREAGDVEVEITLGDLTNKSFYASGTNINNGNFEFNRQTYRFLLTGGKIKTVTKGAFERQWDGFTRIKEVPTYGEISNSCMNGPEHRIAWVNEVVTNEANPTYAELDMVGLQMRSINSDISVSQVSVYKEQGIVLERLRFGKDWGDASSMGPSSNFAEILHWLLCNRKYGMGREINAVGKNLEDSPYVQYRSPLIDQDSFIKSAKFINLSACRFDGALADQTNLRNWATDHAQFFMCNFAIRNGQFSLLPALPTGDRGGIVKNVTVTALFTEGNILEGTFEMEYLPLPDRRNFEAVVKYRVMSKNTLASERTVLVRYKANDGDNLPQEDYDLTSFCTTYDHAVTVAKYMLSLRKRVDHVISFKTIPQGLQVAPGDYIKVQTNLNPYTDVRSGAISNNGRITSIHEVPDGEHEIAVYAMDGENVQRRSMTVQDGVVQQTELYGSLFALPNLQNTFGIYMIEEVTLEEDGAVAITASNHPTTGGSGNNLASKIVEDMQAGDERWTVKTI